jgi:Fe-S cluster assembly protein SufD
VNGRLSSALSDLDELHPGVRWSARRGGTALVVAPDVEQPAPLEVVHVLVHGAGPAAVPPRTHLHLRAGSRLALVERYVGLTGTGRTDPVTTIDVGPGAEVVHLRWQDEPAGVDHDGRLTVRLADRARLTSTSVLLGGGAARAASSVVLHGRDAGVVLRGLALARAAQRLDHVVTVEHAGSGGTSDQLFKSVVDDHARASFQGDVVVAPGTRGTVAHQMSRGLVLSRTAEIATQPWLEILADDVRCTHGATVGRLSPEATFYLRSRGVPEAQARRMLVEAFVGEVIEGVPPAWAQARLRSALERWLGATEAA